MGISVMRVRAVLSMVASILLMFGARAYPSGAAELPDAITSITLTGSSVVGQWERVDLACTWAVPDGSQPGDTFTMQLPPELRWFGSTDFEVVSPSGDVVATAHAYPDGHVVFTLTDFVLTHPHDVHGACTFSTQFISVQSPPGQIDLAFDVGSTVLRVPIVVTDPCVSGCDGPLTGPLKDTWWVDAGQTTLQSVIRADTGPSLSNDVIISDDPGAGIALDCSTAYVVVGQNVGASGYLVAPFHTAQYPATIVCSPTGLTASWANLPPNERLEVWVRSVVTDATLTEYSNHGSVEQAGTTAPVTSVVGRTTASGTGNGTPMPTATPPTPTPTLTPTPTSTPTTSTPTPTGSATTSHTENPPPPPTPSAPSTPPTSSQTSPSGALPETGFDHGALAVLGACMVLAGLATTTIVRRSASGGNGRRAH